MLMRFAPMHPTTEQQTQRQVSREYLVVSVQRATRVSICERELRMCVFLVQCSQFLQNILHLLLRFCQRQAESDDGSKLCGRRR